MKSYLPIFILVGVVLVIAFTGFIFFKNTTSKSNEQDKEEKPAVKELTLEERPYVTLTPDKDGKELILKVSRIPSQVSTVEYEVRYDRFESETGGDISDGVPGSVKVEGQTNIERKLTLGTCSSGVCRYHKGVKDIQLNIRLRDAKGKLVAQKLSTEVIMESDQKILKSADGVLTVTFSKTPAGTWIIMNTFGLPGKSDAATVSSGPYGVFTNSSGAKVLADVSSSKGSVKVWNFSKWDSVSGGATLPGIFVNSSQ